MQYNTAAVVRFSFMILYTVGMVHKFSNGNCCMYTCKFIITVKVHPGNNNNISTHLPHRAGPHLDYVCICCYQIHHGCSQSEWSLSWSMRGQTARLGWSLMQHQICNLKMHVRRSQVHVYQAHSQISILNAKLLFFNIQR